MWVMIACIPTRARGQPTYVQVTYDSARFAHSSIQYLTCAYDSLCAGQSLSKERTGSAVSKSDIVFSLHILPTITEFASFEKRRAVLPRFVPMLLVIVTMSSSLQPRITSGVLEPFRRPFSAVSTLIVANNRLFSAFSRFSILST